MPLILQIKGEYYTQFRWARVQLHHPKKKKTPSESLLMSGMQIMYIYTLFHICVIVIHSYMHMCANVTPITFIAMLVCKYSYIEIINNVCIFHNLKDVWNPH